MKRVILCGTILIFLLLSTYDGRGIGIGTAATKQAVQAVTGIAVWNGTSWVYVPGDGTNGVYVNVKAGTCTATLTGTTPVLTAAGTTIATNQVTVNTTAGGVVIKALNANRLSLMIRNIGSVDCYIGATGVTTATGFLLKAGEVTVLDRNTAAVYGITASSSTTICYIEERA